MDIIFRGFNRAGNEFLYIQTKLVSFPDIAKTMQKIKQENPACVRLTLDVAL